MTIIMLIGGHPWRFWMMSLLSRDKRAVRPFVSVAGMIFLRSFGKTMEKHI